MSDLISRQAAIDALERSKDKTAKGEIGGFYNTIIQNNIDKIKALPSAQPEIIRCKDCIEWDSDSEWCSRHGGTMQENDFCSRAERRTDEQIH